MTFHFANDQNVNVDSGIPEAYIPLVGKIVFAHPYNHAQGVAYSSSPDGHVQATPTEVHVKAPNNWPEPPQINDNKCFTCKHSGGFMTGDTSRTCSTCVGFKNWEVSEQESSNLSLAFDSVFNEITNPKNKYNIKKALGFLGHAKASAVKSKDRSTKVGAVILDPDFNIRSTGWNGFPRGVNDDVEARHERPAKYLWTSHAEENCVAQAANVGVSLKGCTLLVTSLHPCPTCSRLIIQSGIIRVLAPGVQANERWDELTSVAMEMLEEAGVEVVRY